jgi:hypothetical protein
LYLKMAQSLREPVRLGLGKPKACLIGETEELRAEVVTRRTVSLGQESLGVA